MRTGKGNNSADTRSPHAIARRHFLSSVGAGAASLAALAACAPNEPPRARARRGPHDEWEQLRRQFPLDPEYIHMAGLLITAHPHPVSQAIDRYRRALDENPALYLEEHNNELEIAARRAAGDYLGVSWRDVALTDSTTMGIAHVYNGVAIRPGQELLSTTQDYFATHESLRYKARRSDATVRIIEPFADPARATADEVSARILGEIRPETRVLALTWVHSATGVKIPVRQIADGVERINARRSAGDHVLLCLDGVHGLGVEDADLADLGCDFFMAGTHKWLFGPRGTGIIWGNPRRQDAVRATVPTFSNPDGWGSHMTPGGFKAFEHRWAVAHAFHLHTDVGKGQIARRVRALNRQCKEGLAEMPNVRLYTPLDPDMSSGIVCFDVDGMSPQSVVQRLRRQRIVASVTPYDPPHARLAPGLLNNPAEIDAVLAAIRSLSS